MGKEYIYSTYVRYLGGEIMEKIAEPEVNARGCKRKCKMRLIWIDRIRVVALVLYKLQFHERSEKNKFACYLTSQQVPFSRSSS
jgi:hypothetical protein